ncbi:carboxysome shell carbonic anhydrase, partial [Thiococcus pfennigii]|uniref:carboxysome shell carbonic anhydrase n=1 Tax=Thiococcus pfennigii TaxID=1057 RepID=UPI0030B90173
TALREADREADQADAAPLVAAPTVQTAEAARVALDAPRARSPADRVGADAAAQPSRAGRAVPHHPLTRVAENERLHAYESRVKQGFARIVPTLKAISARRDAEDFVSWAQAQAQRQLGFELPERILADAWIDGLDLRALFAQATFETFRQASHAHFASSPLAVLGEVGAFQAFLADCGFHEMNVTPCADGRLAHAVSYVLRLPPGGVRRKAYAGALFDVEEAVHRWSSVEVGRLRGAEPDPVAAPTRYLKVAIYHFSSLDPASHGCAAHGSDTRRAATAALERLDAFRQAIENSFCCGASIDTLLLGIDTDTDALRVHLPDATGRIEIERGVDAAELYVETAHLEPDAARAAIRARVGAAGVSRRAAGPHEGLLRLAARLVENNLSQIDYVLTHHGDRYPDQGHEERFIGVGTDFTDVQLRNLTYFAFMRTVEEGGADLDVGIRIFRRLYVAHGLPIPIVVRCEYPGQVPGARERAVQRCRRIAAAIAARYPDLAEKGLLHTYLTVRDSQGSGPAECVGSSIPGWGGPVS